MIFSHAQHVEQAECGDCHGGVEQDRGKVAGKFIPGKSKCGECHEEALKNKCEMCHRGAKEGMRFARPDRKLNFSHAAHLARGAGLSPGPSGGNPVRVRSGARKM